MFFGDRADMILGEGFTDMRTRDVYGKSCADYVTFKYRVRFPKPEKLEVSVQEAQRIRERLVRSASSTTMPSARTSWAR